MRPFDFSLRVSERIPGDTSKRIVEKLEEGIPEKISREFPREIPRRILEEVLEVLSLVTVWLGSLNF